MMSGMEQQMFIPSITLMNGFRESNYGYEIAFGPNFSLTRLAEGYHDDNGNFVKDDTPPEGFHSVERHHSEGSYSINTGWIWAFGRTFRSGHLNIPVNVYITQPDSKGWQAGFSVGFNMRSHDD